MKLASFIQKLSGETLSVTLKNGSVIQGNLIGSDVSMNMHLKSVKVALKGKNPVSMDALSIRGNNVRYIMLVNSCLAWLISPLRVSPLDLDEAEEVTHPLLS